MPNDRGFEKYSCNTEDEARAAVDELERRVSRFSKEASGSAAAADARRELKAAKQRLRDIELGL